MEKVRRVAIESLGVDWQPIETAPADYPDGEPPRILVWVENGGGNHKGAVAFGCVYIGHTTKSRTARADGYGGNGEWRITHWMPLPEPPGQ